MGPKWTYSHYWRSFSQYELQFTSIHKYKIQCFRNTNKAQQET